MNKWHVMGFIAGIALWVLVHLIGHLIEKATSKRNKNQRRLKRHQA